MADAQAVRSARFAALRVERDAPSDWRGPCPSTARFETINVPLCIINAVRRTALSDIATPALVFDPQQPGADPSMRFLKNTTALHNELLGQRLSLVPLHLDEDQLQAFDPARFRFVLHAKNTGTDVTSITSKDIAIFDNMGVKYPASVRDAMFPPSPMSGDHVLLARLRPSPAMDTNGDEVHVEARAVLGTGHDHACHVNVSCCSLRGKQDTAEAERQLARLLRDKPDAAPRERRLIAAQFRALDAHRCVLPGVFEVVVTSETRLRPTYVVFLALRGLAKRVRAVLDAVRQLGGDEAVQTAQTAEDVGHAQHHHQGASMAAVQVVRITNMDDFYHVVMRNEDHTLGNLLQQCLYDLWLRDDGGRNVSYVGYTMPHPQDPLVLLKIKLAPAGRATGITARLDEGLAHVLKLLEDLTFEWVTFAGLVNSKDPPASAVDDWVLHRAGRRRAQALASASAPAPTLRPPA